MELDGYNPIDEIKLNSSTGKYGIDNKGNRIYVLEGNSYDIGYMFGVLGERNGNNVSKMCNTYVEHTALGFLAPRFDEMIQEHPLVDNIISELLKLYKFILTKYTLEIFQNIKQSIPDYLLRELNGMVDGSRSITRDIKVESLIVLNFSMDVLTTLIYSGKIYKIIKEKINNIKYTNNTLYKTLKSFSKKLIHVPSSCDGFFVKGGATKNDNSFFCRDYQLQNARVWQDTVAMVVYKNKDVKYKCVSVSSPGFIGSFTILNEKGFAMGLDMIRSGAVNPENPGLGSTVMVRHIGSNSRDVKDAKKLLKSANKGSAWIYGIADKTNASVCIGGANNISINPEPMVKNILFSKLSKSISHSDSGTWFRDLDYKLPKKYLYINKDLFNIAGNAKIPIDLYNNHLEYFKNTVVSTNKNNVVIDLGLLYENIFNNPLKSKIKSMFPSFQVENILQSYLKNNYFSPLYQSTNEYIIFGNQTTIPNARISQMTRECNKIASTADAINWRISNLNFLIEANYGNIDFDKAKYIITNLSPWKQPYYPLNNIQYGYKNLGINSKSKLVISGAISVCDLKQLYMETKMGYWGEEWGKCSLNNY